MCALFPTATCLLMQRVVPETVQEVTHAFESIGHIAHLNLRDELLPYKHIIGQVSCPCSHVRHMLRYCLYYAC